MSSSTDQRPIAGYIPDNILTYIGIVAWGVLALVLWTRLFMHGFRRYMLSIAIGVSCMLAGFILRLPVHNNPYSLGIGIAMIAFTLLPPCAFLAQDYVTLPKLAKSIQVDGCLLIKEEKLMKYFLWSDGITFFVQMSGGGLEATKSESTAKIGQYVALVGLVLQTLSFCLYTVALIVFGSRVRARYPEVWRNEFYVPSIIYNPAPTGESPTKLLQPSTDSYPMQHVQSSATYSSTSKYPPQAGGSVGTFLRDDGKWYQNWKYMYYALAVTCVGILIRSVYRTIEYAMGYKGYLMEHEWNFYVFDALPLYIAAWMYGIMWPVPVLEKSRGQSVGPPKAYYA